MSLFPMASVIMTIGTILQIVRVSKTRKLKGYDLVGSLITLMSITLFNIQFAYDGHWDTVIINSVTIAYWAFVLYKLLTLTVNGIGE